MGRAQVALFEAALPAPALESLKQLLKWVGNKHRFAGEIISFFPTHFGVYFEPFLGSGAVLGRLAPVRAVGSDNFEPLMEIWTSLSKSPDQLRKWYADRWHAMARGDKVKVYERIKASYNAKPNGADLLFICRACYGGVVRFRKGDGYISTPCGAHMPIHPDEFARRVDEWHRRTQGTTFLTVDFEKAMDMAERGDLVYCDPPYSHSQSILYGAQAFELERLFDMISRCKSRGVFVALSIDGTKRSGDMVCNVPIPKRLFEREMFVHVGRSMLKRFQMSGRSLEREVVADRLLLNY
jgi:DNA adenine methylase